MNSPSHAANWAMAGVVLVILPLLIALSTLGANLALESSGAGVSVLGRVGTSQAILAGWSIVAVTVVGGLIATLLHQQHE